MLEAGSPGNALSCRLSFGMKTALRRKTQRSQRALTARLGPRNFPRKQILTVRRNLNLTCPNSHHPIPHSWWKLRKVMREPRWREEARADQEAAQDQPEQDQPEQDYSQNGSPQA